MSSSEGVPTDHAFTIGFIACTLVGVLAIAAAVVLPSAHRRQIDAVAVGVEDLPDEPVGLHLHLPQTQESQKGGDHGTGLGADTGH